MSDPASPDNGEALTQVLGWDAQSFLQKITSVAPNIIYVFNQKTQSNEYSNHSLGERMGYSPSEIQAMGADLMPMLCHPDDLSEMFSYFGDLRKMADGQVSTLEYRMKHRDGHWVWLHSHDTIFERDENGEVLRHIGTATDITAQKEAEARALLEKRIADEANDELRSFAYSVSHDLKAPSNTLSMLLSEMETALANDDKDDLADLLASGDETVTRMGVLIEDVLHYTRVIDGGGPHAKCDLSKIADDVLVDLRAQISSSGAEIETGPLPVISGNEAQIRILLQNLVVNAIRYQPAGATPKVWISSETDPVARQLTLRVRDNGIGIDPKLQERIFTMFARLHREQDYPGTGLGLAICRRIATNHGGVISVESAPGEGSVFSVTLQM